MDTQESVNVVDLKSFGEYWTNELTKEDRASMCNQVLGEVLFIDRPWGLIPKEQQEKLYCAFRRFGATCE